jgi:hypothetical protein
LVQTAGNIGINTFKEEAERLALEQKRKEEISLSLSNSLLSFSQIKKQVVRPARSK